MDRSIELIDDESLSLLATSDNVRQNTYRTAINRSQRRICDCKTFAFIFVGTITLAYCVGELTAGLYVHSLALMSDGFHNLSDVVSIIIGYAANKAKDKAPDKYMSYGYARTELIGAMTNACFLLSLSFYILLESIPRFITKTPLEHANGFLFIIVAGAGLAANTLGTIIFCLTGGGHGHSHAGGGHGHSHGGSHSSTKKEKHGYDDHGHSHGDKKKKKEKHGHGDKEEDHGHSHDKKKKHSHGDIPEGIEGGEDHGHSHDKKKKEKHSHGDNEDHGHSHDKKKEKHGHGHGDKEDHGHSHGDKKKKGDKKHSHDDHGHDDHHKEKEDLNVKAIFLHYFGDMISSLFVLGQGVLLHFFPDAKWSPYVDPATSLIIVFIILITTLPLVKTIIKILLQSIPAHIDLEEVQYKINLIDGIAATHDLHIWQLVDGVIISSVHVMVKEGSDFKRIVSKIKKVFHSYGIHSSSIQPEFVGKDIQIVHQFCEEMCVEDCEEDWCCKKPSELSKSDKLIIN